MAKQLRPVTEHRVQVNFPADLYEKVRRQAFRDKISISEVVRQCIRASLEIGRRARTVDEKEARQKRREAFMKKYVGMIRGARDGSVNHDKWAARTAIFHKL